MQAVPPVAAAVYDAVNADKVDGRHAVAAATTPASRAGKLVATNSSGRQPNDIIATAPNAAKLGGFLPAAYLLKSPGSVPGTQITVLTFLPQPIDGSNPRTDGSFDLQVWSYN